MERSETSVSKLVRNAGVREWAMRTSLVIEIESVGDVDQATDSAIFGCGSVVTASDLVGDRDCCVVNRVTAWTEQGRF
eukprot:m.201902 g.201902  ORF g.201902 m.201902 type:complete len:78 (-) comp25241_c0_seq3:1115-1348(-)